MISGYLHLEKRKYEFGDYFCPFLGTDLFWGTKLGGHITMEIAL